MKTCANAEEALAFVQKHGVVLVSAKGEAPRLTEAIVGGSISGNWWLHAQSRQIYAVLCAVADSDQILTCRLAGGKVTMVHRRLWPHLVRAAGHFTAGQLARVRESHTPSGKHTRSEIPFPQWVPGEVVNEADLLSEEEALSPFIKWHLDRH